MSASLTRGGGENVTGIPGACATRNFTYLVRGPCDATWGSRQQRVWPATIQRRASHMCRGDKRGPSSVPWGTPESTDTVPDLSPSSTTHCFIHVIIHDIRWTVLWYLWNQSRTEIQVRVDDQGFFVLIDLSIHCRYLWLCTLLSRCNFVTSACDVWDAPCIWEAADSDVLN